MPPISHGNQSRVNRSRRFSALRAHGFGGPAGRRASVNRSVLTRKSLLQGFSLLTAAAGLFALLASFELNLNRPDIGLVLFASGTLSFSMARRTDYVPTPPAAKSSSSGLVSWGPGLMAIFVAPAVWLATGRDDLFFFMMLSTGSALLVPHTLRVETSKDAAFPLAAGLLIDLEILWRMTQFSPGPIGVDPWFHASVIRHMVAIGGVPASAAVYSASPLFHALGA